MERILLTFFTAFFVALFASPSGISGAFLLLPFQVSILGITDPSANATNFLYNLIAIPSGIYRYWRERRMLWILAINMIIGYFPGIYLGSLIRTSYLLDLKKFKLFIGLVLLFLGANLLRSLNVRQVRDIDRKIREFRSVKGFVSLKKIGAKLIIFDFWNEEYSFSPIGVFFIAFFVGIIGGAYGVGGGALIAPIIISLFKLPIHAIAGANLLGTYTSSIFGILSYASLGYMPKLDIGLALGSGGVTGMYFGARIQKYLPERVIRLSLTTLIILLALRYISQFFI